MQAEMQDFLSLELVEKAEKLFCKSISPYPKIK
jgi:hypothetical protein